MNTNERFGEIERWYGAAIAEALRTMIATQGDLEIGRVRFYAAEDIVERNQTYQTQTYCPGYVTIGDDGGGRAIMVHGALEPPTVFVVGHGVMSEEDFVAVGECLQAWLGDGCPVD
ncbi:hypothetical protein [Lysobacter sp. CA199]|uniref:hypothetical protein n=1 Tax=Lysobacter sp. CA199 TaxID=3455608 RepID=UPI003F8D13AD